MSPNYSSQTGRSTAQNKTSLKHTLVYQLKMSIPLTCPTYQMSLLFLRKRLQGLPSRMFERDRLASWEIPAISITPLSWASR